MKKIIFLALLGLVYLNTAFAQSQKVSGVVWAMTGSL
jgi:hypothetical protein